MAQDSLEQLATQIKKYMEFSRRIMRRWWIIGLFTFVGAGASVALALTMTRIYESRTLISWKESVNKDRIFSPEENRREDNWLRMRLVEAFSSHTLRMKIVKEHDLYDDMRGHVPPEVLLKELSRAIKHDMVGTDSFWISFEYKDPRKSQQVTARLADEFIHKFIGDALGAAQTTLTFMEREAKKAKQEMGVVEGNIAEFVSDHPEYQIDPATGLPRVSITAPASTGQSYAHVSNPELRRALSKKGRLQAKLQIMLNPQSNSKVAQARQQLERAKQRVAILRRQYTDRHPDVQRARAYARQLQTSLASVTQSQSGSSAGVGRIRDEMAELDRTIARLSRSKRRKPKAAKSRAAGDHRLSRKARLEKRFYQLSREREVAKAKYEQLETQLLNSKMAANLERKQAETQFTIVDKAHLPRKPIRPSRTKLALAGTAAGLMLGFGLAILLVIFDPRIYNEDDLRKACDLPLLAQIPKEA